MAKFFISCALCFLFLGFAFGLSTFVAAFAWLKGTAFLFLSVITISIAVVSFIFATKKPDPDLESTSRLLQAENTLVDDSLPTYRQAVSTPPPSYRQAVSAPPPSYAEAVGAPPTYAETQALLAKQLYPKK